MKHIIKNCLSVCLLGLLPVLPAQSDQAPKDGYPFPILSDLDDQVMKSYNLYFEVPEELRVLYVENFSLDIAAYNGEGRYGLPVPGTFIIDRQGVIRASFADTDYTKRMEPAAIIEALDKLDEPDRMPAGKSRVDAAPR